MMSQGEKDMRSKAKFPIHGPGARAMALAALAGFSSACVSGGGSPPPTGAYAEAIIANLTGVWVLDESSSTPEPDLPQITDVATSVGGSPLNTAALRRAAFGLLLQRPTELALRTDGAHLAYMPSPGDTIRIPTNGDAASRRVNEQFVRTRIFWEGGRLGIEHALDVWRVREILDLVDGRLEITRTMRRTGVSLSPVVLRFHRARPG